MVSCIMVPLVLLLSLILHQQPCYKVVSSTYLGLTLDTEKRSCWTQRIKNNVCGTVVFFNVCRSSFDKLHVLAQVSRHIPPQVLEAGILVMVSSDWYLQHNQVNLTCIWLVQQNLEGVPCLETWREGDSQRVNPWFESSTFVLQSPQAHKFEFFRRWSHCLQSLAVSEVQIGFVCFWRAYAKHTLFWRLLCITWKHNPRYTPMLWDYLHSCTL